MIHGPNLNLLGEREPDLYGRERLSDIDARLVELGRAHQAEVETFQSNSEGDIVNKIQQSRGRADVLIINPAAYTHTSLAIQDAVRASGIPTIEVHLTNIYAREPERRVSYVAPVAAGSICGFGAKSYELALQAALSLG